MQLYAVYRAFNRCFVNARANGFVCLRGLRLTTQPVPSGDASGMDPSQRCDVVKLCGKAAQQAETLKQGDKLHVVIRFYEFYGDSVEAYTDLDEAKARFKEREEYILSEVEDSRQINKESGFRFGMMKFNKYHCDMIECCVKDGMKASSPAAWHGPHKGYALWLVTLVIDGLAINLDEKGEWPPAN